MSRPDVGGSSGGLQGPSARAARRSAQNTLFLNGVNVGDPAAIGAAGFYYDFDAFDDIQVSTGAHDITVPTVRRLPEHGYEDAAATSGRAARRSRGSATTRRRATITIRRCRSTAFRPDSDTSNFVSDVNVTVGGPLVQNKLRFFGAFRDWRVHQNVPVQNSQSRARSDQHHVRPWQRHLTS